MSPLEKWEHMEDEELTYEDVCDEMASAYDVLVANREWGPAKLPTDPMSVPPQFANLANHMKTLIQEATSGQQKKGTKDQLKNVTCYRCGKQGHFANKCPLRNAEKDKSGGPKPKSWKATPPKEGEALTKRVKHNTFHWCAKCKRWTPTHNTVTHRGKPKGNNDDGDDGEKEPSASLLELDPSAWMFSYGVDDGVVTRGLRERVRVLAQILPVTLDPNGSIKDHVNVLEYG